MGSVPLRSATVGAPLPSAGAVLGAPGAAPPTAAGDSPLSSYPEDRSPPWFPRAASPRSNQAEMRATFPARNSHSSTWFCSSVWGSHGSTQLSQSGWGARHPVRAHLPAALYCAPAGCCHPGAPCQLCAFRAQHGCSVVLGWEKGRRESCP